MTSVRIQKIIVSKGIEEHIGKHQVTLEEANEVIHSDVFIIEGHSGRKILVSKVGRRILSVIVEMTGNKLKIKTARDANKIERGGYYEFEKNKQKKA